MRKELAYFTSFYLSSLTRGLPAAATCAHVAEDHPIRRPLALDHHERGAQYRRFDADLHLVDASMQRIFEDARGYASTPCVLPPVSPPTEESALPDRRQ